MARLPKGLWNKSDINNETSEVIRARVKTCREIQLNRQNKANAHLSSPELKVHCHLSMEDCEFLELAVEKLGLSTRAHHKILKIARTIADMQGKEDIGREHIIEALSYRAMDRLIQHLTANLSA